MIWLLVCQVGQYRARLQFPEKLGNTNWCYIDEVDGGRNTQRWVEEEVRVEMVDVGRVEGGR